MRRSPERGGNNWNRACKSVVRHQHCDVTLVATIHFSPFTGVWFTDFLFIHGLFLQHEGCWALSIHRFTWQSRANASHIHSVNANTFTPFARIHSDTAFWFTVGSFLLTIELSCLQLAILAFYLQLEENVHIRFESLTYNWMFFAYSGKVHLISALRDREQTNSTVSISHSGQLNSMDH